MKIYTIENDVMKAFKTILTAAEKSISSPSREWTRYAYLSPQGLACTDGKRLLRVHDAGLDEEFSSFMQETGRVLIFSLAGSGLALVHDEAKNDSYLGTLNKVIPTDEAFNGASSAPFSIHFTPEGYFPKMKDISKSMVNTAILATGHWFDPSIFDGMGVRPWVRVRTRDASCAFRGNNEDEVFVAMGTCWEGV